jgi:hypothetical protein
MKFNPKVIHNTEDKQWWCHHGEHLEASFVELCKTQFGIDMAINPQKATDPYAPDLTIDLPDMETYLADLKTQNTPFFTASRYRLDPQYAVTFNRKDYERYRELYPQLLIFFWVEWKQTTWRDRCVRHMAGIFEAPFSLMRKAIEEGRIPEHEYIARVNDNSGNAKSSFVFNLLDTGIFNKMFLTIDQ